MTTRHRVPGAPPGYLPGNFLKSSHSSDLGRKIMRASTRLRMGDRVTYLEGGSLPPISLALDPQSIVRDCFPRDLPTPVEMEHAIELVEDVITKARIAYANRGVLEISSVDLWKIPGLASDNAPLTRDDIEEMFNRLAMAAHGQRRALGDIPPEPQVAAALIILRECMHHLGFEAVRAYDRICRCKKRG